MLYLSKEDILMRKMKLVALFTAALVAISSLPVYAANFADINNVPWEGAKTYINSVADKGIMVGDYNNAGQKVFRPKDGVTYCETMQLAYSLMKNSSGEAVPSTTVSKYTTVMNGYKIPSWAHEAVAYGLENKIVTISEIPAFVNSKGVSVNATRQDVAIIFGRTLDLIEELPTNPTLTYGDKASITAVATPYVALLKQLNIMTGDTDGNFTPKASINRAEMAVVVSKTYDHLSGKGTTTTQTTTGSISGKVTNAVTVGNNTTLVVGGKQFMGDISTGVLDVNSARIALSQVKVGDTVVVSYSGSKIMSVMVTASGTGSAVVEDWDAKGDFVSMGTYTIKIKVDGDTETYEFKDIDDVNFKYENKVMDADKFKDKVEVGDTIYITLDSKDYVETVVAEEGATIDFDIEGYFASIEEGKIKLKLSKSGTSKSYAFEDDDYDNVEFYKSTTTSKVSYSTFKKYVVANDEIGLVYNDDDEVEKVYIITRADAGDYDVEGEFYSVNERSIRIKDEDGKKVYYYFVGNEDDEDEEEDIYEDVEFYNTKGKEVDFDDFKDLIEDYKGNVGLVLDKNDEVIEIYLVEAEEKSKYDVEGYFLSITESRIKLGKTASTSSGDTHYFKGYEDDEEDLYENVKYYDAKGKEVKDFDDFDEMLKKGDKIGIILNDDDEVTKIYIISGGSSDTETKSGDLNKLESKKIKISGNSKTYTTDSDTDVDIKDGEKKVDTYDELMEAYSDEKKDFYVTITFDEDYVVSKIEGYVTKVADAKITSVSTSGDTIKVKCDGTTYTYELDGSCDFELNDSDYDDDFDGLDELVDDAEDDNDYVYIDIKLNKNGKVTDIEVVDVK